MTINNTHRTSSMPAWEQSLTPNRKALLIKTEEQAILFEGGDHAWLDYDSIIASRIFMAPYNEDKFRKSDGTPECTHSIEVADRAVNKASKSLIKEFGKEAIAFIAYHHDTFENNPSLSIEETVDKLWKGSSKKTSKIIEALTLLTDTPELSKSERMEEQITRANDDPSGIIALIREADKTCPIIRDLQTIDRGIIPLNGNKEEYMGYLKKRVFAVSNMKKLPKNDQAAFMDIVTQARKGINLISPPTRPLYLPYIGSIQNHTTH